MTVRAKFVVTAITRRGNGSYGDIVMNPVYAPGDPQSENGKFWQASPSGELKLSINNPAAFEQFNPGQEFYLDFTPATPAQ